MIPSLHKLLPVVIYYVFMVQLDQWTGFADESNNLLRNQCARYMRCPYLSAHCHVDMYMYVYINLCHCLAMPESNNSRSVYCGEDVHLKPRVCVEFGETSVIDDRSLRCKISITLSRSHFCAIRHVRARYRPDSEGHWFQRDFCIQIYKLAGRE